MNPIFKQSLDCGVTASKPDIAISFFPIHYSEYIIIENAEVEGSYDHIDEIASYLSGVLLKNSIKIIQLKFSEKDNDILAAIKYLGLTLSQANFLIKNARLVISNSKYTTETASALNIPNINISKPQKINKDKPYWYPSKHVEFSTKAFAEEISKTAIDYLELDNPLTKVNPIYCGESYKSKILEAVPNFDPATLNLANENINLRADYTEETKFIESFLSNNRVNLICKKMPKILNFHKNIIQINLEVSLETSLKEIESAKRMCPSLFLYSRNPQDIQKIRLKFIDYEISLEKKTEKKDLDICGKICDNTFYKSSKIIISEGKNYTSYAAMKRNKILTNQRLEKVIDCNDFWEESEHFKLINIDHG